MRFRLMSPCYIACKQYLDTTKSVYEIEDPTSPRTRLEVAERISYRNIEPLDPMPPDIAQAVVAYDAYQDGGAEPTISVLMTTAPSAKK